jgi:hypothetical protein
MVDPELIAEAFINRVPYYDGEYIVVHRAHFCSVESAIGVDVDVGSHCIYGREILHVTVRQDGEVTVMVDPRWVKHVEVLDAALRRLSDIIGVEMRAVRLADDIVSVVVRGFKYVFVPNHAVSTITRRGSVRVYGYVRRFAPFSRCPECVEIAERIKEVQRELDYKRRELEDIMYSLEWEKLCTILERVDVSIRQLRRVLRKAKNLAHRRVVVEGVGINIGPDSPRALLSRYLRALSEIDELVAKIKTELALEKLLS